MGLQRGKCNRKGNYASQARFIFVGGLPLDDDLEQLEANIRDPFATFVDHDNYGEMIVDFNGCTDSLVAGISEKLGYPYGLSFDDMYHCIK